MGTIGTIGTIETMVKVEKNHGNVERVTGKKFGSLMSFDENVEK